MKSLSRICSAAVLITPLILGGMITDSFAQLKEPDVVKQAAPKTPLRAGFSNEFGFDIMLNNFGFSVGAHYNKVITNYTEVYFKTGITGIRDVSEQTFQSFFTGNRTIPNKFKRGFGFPFLLGLQQRIFAEEISDNFRLFLGGALGPAMAFTYPYLKDSDGNGFRTIQYDPQSGRIVGAERLNDFFTGWGDGSTHWGFSGELTIGADIGSSFGHRTKLEFGYFFYYFKKGLQIMEPYRPTEYNPDSGLPVDATKESFYDAQQYFGSPQIKFTYGFMW